MRVLFLHDNHYGSHGGAALASALASSFDLTVWGDDYSERLATAPLDDYEVLMTCAIGDTPGSPHAPAEAEGPVRRWLEGGRPVVLVHGGSATFWKWSWWRSLVGLRWVRRDDPDGFAPSIHPIVDFQVEWAKSRHPLVTQLAEVSIENDELYTELEETRPVQRLLEARHGGRSHPMAWTTTTDWGGPVFGYLPGHAARVVTQPENVENVARLLAAACSR